MPMVECENGHRWRWANTRGSRMADAQCQCGAAVHRITYNPDTEQWERLELAGKTKGRKMERCAICGKRRSVPGGGQRVQRDTIYTLEKHIGGWLTGRIENEQRTVKAGEIVCWHHEPHHPVRLYLPEEAA